MLAAKTSLCARVDALGEETAPSSIGIDSRAKIEERLRQCEQGKVSGRVARLWEEHSGCGLFPCKALFHSSPYPSPQIRKISGTGKAMARAEKYEMKRSVHYINTLCTWVYTFTSPSLASSSPLPSSSPLCHYHSPPLSSLPPPLIFSSSSPLPPLSSLSLAAPPSSTAQLLTSLWRALGNGRESEGRRRSR